ncbi:NADP-dependent malic enzyme-like [Diorhabda carinulata]|uniref:NADP-dependent malic enzyme-like n=1 Tax=Diorhabda carinulata TaxID=1163345 RepID=UPI0025A2D2DF|nr:NADP-dependent malic enzyme-like [Diorhabda carinulata]
MLWLCTIVIPKYSARNITIYNHPRVFQNSKKNWYIICRYASIASKSRGLDHSRALADASRDENKRSLEKDRLGQPGLNHGDHCMYPLVSGLERLRNGNLNKGLAFSLEERQILGIHGLLPPVIKTQEEQINKVKMNLDCLKEPLDKYMWLIDLMQRNEKLFYAFVRKYVKECLPLLYTPTVGAACVNWSKIYRFPRGMYITIHDRGHVYDILKNWPEHDVRVIVFTDGERILGLGDLGACGMGIPIGKLCLYTALAGIKPHQCLPVTLDCGTNNQAFLKDPFYVGLREKRHRGPEYDEFVDEFMSAVVQRWGQNTLLQFEDFGNSNAFRFLDKYKDKYCTFNDDIQGTASVTVAGILSALKITKNKFSDHTILFQGAGEANIGIAQLCVQAMVASGASPEEARKKIWLIDSQGLICKGRKEPIQSQKAEFAKEHKPMKKLNEIVREIKPSILIGAAAVGGAFTPEILQEMAKNHKRPIVFALSNPTEKAECTPEQAYKETKGQVIYASGSPFPPVQYEGKTYITGQSNNSYVFPGIGLAGVAGGIPHYNDEHFLTTAQALADLVTEEDLNVGRIFPPIENILEVSVKIATKLVEHSYQQCMATVYPEPEDKEAFIRAQMYNTDYEQSFPCPFDYPESAKAESSC